VYVVAQPCCHGVCAGRSAREDSVECILEDGADLNARHLHGHCPEATARPQVRRAAMVALGVPRERLVRLVPSVFEKGSMSLASLIEKGPELIDERHPPAF
jgi:hypothetical protein